MAVTDTTTIRVSRRTRDQLADEARRRGLSVSALVAEMAREAEVGRIIASEREACRRDALNPAVAEEEALWDTVTGDGIE